MGKYWQFFFFLIELSCFVRSIINGEQSKSRLPIVFVYTVAAQSCKPGLRSYIKDSLEQAIQTQPDCDIILVSNFAECVETEKIVEKVHNLIKIDSSQILSNRTMLYRNVTKSIFKHDLRNVLWSTSALRFFIMEDLMTHYGYKEMMHVEADNLLYGKLTTILPTLRAHYRLAATPLTVGKIFITASVFWIGNLKSITQFNDYLLLLGNSNGTEWKGYMKWLRKYGCCLQGGYDPDEKGNGVKPFAVNEMSMLGYYHEINPLELRLFPVVPPYDKFPKPRDKNSFSLVAFAPSGSETGPATGSGIWDPNSWGQFIGGTYKWNGVDKGFIDASHISGKSMKDGGCRVTMECGNQSSIVHQPIVGEGNGTHFSLSSCYTAPHVICGRKNESKPDLSAVFTPLWNLHVHSKHTIDYRSVPCNCVK